MSEPRLLGEILKDYFANSNEPLAVGFRQHFGIKQGDTSSVFNTNDATPSDNPIEDWLDNQDVMQLLHISQRTLQTLRSNGTLPYSRINNKIYYRRKDIQQILADHYKMNQIRYDYGKPRK